MMRETGRWQAKRGLNDSGEAIGNHGKALASIMDWLNVTIYLRFQTSYYV